jgi:hypothetical protein
VQVKRGENQCCCTGNRGIGVNKTAAVIGKRVNTSVSTGKQGREPVLVYR